MNDPDNKSAFDVNSSPISVRNEVNGTPTSTRTRTSENRMLLHPEKCKQAQNKFKETYKILWWCAFQMTICFVVTFMVYPGVAQATKLKFLSGSSS